MLIFRSVACREQAPSPHGWVHGVFKKINLESLQKICGSVRELQALMVRLVAYPKVDN